MKGTVWVRQFKTNGRLQPRYGSQGEIWRRGRRFEFFSGEPVVLPLKAWISGSAVLGLTLFPIGYLLQALTR